MQKGIFNVPTPVNETVLTYTPGTSETICIEKGISQKKVH